MKRLSISIALATLCASALPFLAKAGGCYVDPVHVYAGSGRVISGVFMRNEACIEGSTILTTLSAGANVQVIGFTDGWYRVESTNGARGWVGQQFIENAASRTGTTWDSYREYMDTYPSRAPSTSTTTPPPSGDTTYTGTVEHRHLVKLICPSSAAADHPCKAVYYIGGDGKRHAYPHGRAFLTWYLNFNDVKAVTAERLGQFMLGPNITYRPGSRMVKFTTDPKVYAVARGGVLRWVKTEALAIALYGTDWNKKIDDIQDAFYTNYTFGSEIDSAAAYSPTTELDTAPTFD